MLTGSERTAWAVLAAVAIAVAGVFAFMWAQTAAQMEAREAAERDAAAYAAQVQGAAAARERAEAAERARAYAGAKARADRLTQEQLQKFRARLDRLRQHPGEPAAADRVRDAIRDFEDAIDAADPRVPPERPEPADLKRSLAAQHVEEAKVHLAGGRLDGAAAALDRAAELWPEHGEIAELRARIAAARKAAAKAD